MAGYLHAGEDYEGGARRRLWEELSVEGDPRRVGVVSLADGPATKFVGVFVFSTSRATEFVLLEGHVARVDWDSLEHLKNAMNDFPETYTETFRQVFAYLIGHI